jgi:hypothetical protein
VGLLFDLLLESGNQSAKSFKLPLLPTLDYLLPHPLTQLTTWSHAYRIPARYRLSFRLSVTKFRAFAKSMTAISQA